MADELTDEVLGAAVLTGLPDPVVVLGPDAALLWANPRAEQRFGWALDDLRRQPLGRLIHPDDLGTALLSMESVQAKEVGSLIEIRLRDRSGTYAWFESRGAPWVGSPVPGAIIVVLRESTERRRWELGAGNTAMLATLLDSIPTINLLLGPDGTIRGANRALTRRLHRDLEGTLGRSFLDLVAPNDHSAVAGALATADGTSGTVTLEACLLRYDGAQVPMSLTFVDLVADQVVQGIVVAASDITALVEVRTELHHLATHDLLTGLPNRGNLLSRLTAVLAQDPASPHTLIFGDLDKLKPVNDSHGHRAGDAVLAEVAGRLRSVLRAGDFVARLSGDEFVVVVPTDDPAVVRDVQDRIGQALSPPVRLPDGHLVTTSMSLGTATTAPGLSAEEVLAVADAAMYVAKRARDRAT